MSEPRRGTRAVDRDARRAELGEAVWRVIRQRGVGEVSVRHVAEEAGWSRGIVQLYFRDKEELMLVAYERAAERARERNRRTTSGLTDLAAARALLLSYACPDEEQLTINAVLLGLQTRAVASARLAAAYEESMRAWRERTVAAFEDMQRRGAIGTALDARAAALDYFAFMLGLRLQTTIEPDLYGREEAAALVDQFLAFLAP
jgi:AcrR family transcriptional regulator